MGRLIDDFSRGEIKGGTPLDDISDLIPDYILNKKDLDEAEYRNINKAMIKYVSGALSQDLSLSYFYKVHRDMFCDVWRWAGKKRRINLNIGCDKVFIDDQLFNLAEDVSYMKESGVDDMELAAILHHRLVKIHPFMNGNGRWARLVVNHYLKDAIGKMIYWPEEKLLVQNDLRSKYIASLQKADKGDLSELVLIQKTLI